MSLNARELAAEALRDRSGNVSARLDRLLMSNPLSPADRALAREITLGVERRRGSLNAILRSYLTRRRKRLADPIRRALQVGLYQILFCDRIPDFASVDQSVTMIRHSRHRGAAGFINGLLRTIARERKIVETAGPDECVVPVDLKTGLRFPRPVLRDPSTYPVEHLAAAWSLPPALVTRWLEAHGLETTWALGAHSCAHPPMICRVNTLKGTLGQVMDELDAPMHSNAASVVLPRNANLGELPAFIEGRIQPQDPTATASGAACQAKPGMRVFDFCAAPGTKTIHLAEQMRNDGHITAVDVSEEKLDRIRAGCERMGVGIVEPVLAADLATIPLRSFDLVLVDAPCSNTGVLARRPEARWRFDEDALNRYRRDQVTLLRAAAEYVGPGGRLVYSTCSIEPDEDERVVRRVAKALPHMKLLHRQLTLPGGSDDPTRWHDGGYVAVFRD